MPIDPTVAAADLGEHDATADPLADPAANLDAAAAGQAERRAALHAGVVDGHRRAIDAERGPGAVNAVHFHGQHDTAFAGELLTDRRIVPALAVARDGLERVADLKALVDEVGTIRGRARGTELVVAELERTLAAVVRELEG